MNCESPIGRRKRKMMILERNGPPEDASRSALEDDC